MAVDAGQTAIRHPLWLWAGWVVGPVAWSLHLMVSYVLVGWVCRTGQYWMLHAVTLVTLAMAVAGAWVAWRQWSAVGRRWPGSGGGPVARTRFLAVCGLIVSALSALLIVMEGLPNFIVGACL